MSYDIKGNNDLPFFWLIIEFISLWMLDNDGAKIAKDKQTFD